MRQRGSNNRFCVQELGEALRAAGKGNSTGSYNLSQELETRRRAIGAWRGEAWSAEKNIRSKPKTPLESTLLTNEPSIFMSANSLFARTQQLTDKYDCYWICAGRHGKVVSFGAPTWLRFPWEGANREPSGIPKGMNIENEGTSHDVDDNKGSNFLSHDVYDK